MNLEEAINQPLSNYSNVNVKVWARPVSYAGTQPLFSLDSEALIQLDKPEGYEEFWDLHACNYQTLSQGLNPAQVVELVHSFYRVSAPIQNPY